MGLYACIRIDSNKQTRRLCLSLIFLPRDATDTEILYHGLTPTREHRPDLSYYLWLITFL